MTTQDIAYSNQDNERWERLIQKLTPSLAETNREFREGLLKIELPVHHIPTFAGINNKTVPLTGWKYEPATGKVSMYDFLASLAQKVFYAETQIRPEDEFDFCKLPDIFHDVYGHAAMLVHPGFCTFLEELGRLAIQYADSTEAINNLASIYWYTAEVGLIYEKEELRFYGGSIISSVSEINTVKKETTQLLPYNVQEVMNTSYNSYDVNDRYFYIQSLTDLNDSLPEIRSLLQQQYTPSLQS